MRLGSILAAIAAAGAVAGVAAPRTVCTITVNSADERESFRRHLPAGDYEFVELVERGRPDWLASSCHRGIQCDVLVVSGHFAGTEFYSSRPEVTETLKVDEIERVQCGGSCGLFSHLKEVYLFGCDSLKPEPVRSAMPEVIRELVREGASEADARRDAAALSERYAESSRDLMRRLFPDVPAIYGFASLAPYGRTAGPLLDRYLEGAAPGEVGSGVASERLLALFGPSSMVATSGVREDEPAWAWRGEACRYADERNPLAARIALMHEALAADGPDVRMSFTRAEKFFASLPSASDAQAGSELTRLADDASARGRYLALTRETTDPALRVRMVALARAVGWLDAAGQQAELAAAIVDVMASRAMGFGEVDLVCGLNEDRALDPELALFNVSRIPRGTAQEAARACLGSDAARREVLRALSSRDEREVQLAQAYLRHRPIVDEAELRSVALGIANMPASAGQVRALETIARQHVADGATFEALAALYARTRSPQVQRAVAEIFLRSDRAALPASVAETLRRRRLAPAGRDALIDQLIAALPARPGS
ncbi:MAG TPA: hypothetical protein VH040_17145 [Usitatibacter sp.]|jgi:hypothetical protein|nr:hypothetical protein [Usitatibacter sp.]